MEAGYQVLRQESAAESSSSWGFSELINLSNYVSLSLQPQLDQAPYLSPYPELYHSLAELYYHKHLATPSRHLSIASDAHSELSSVQDRLGLAGS